MWLLFWNYLGIIPYPFNLIVVGLVGYFVGKNLKKAVLIAITAIELSVLVYSWATSRQEIMILIPMILSIFDAVFLSAMWLTHIA